MRLHTGSDHGLVSGQVNVFYRHEPESSDSPGEKFVALQVRAEVIPEYRITPREVDFGEIDGLSTQRVRQVVRVTPEAAEGVTIRQVRATSDFLSARVLPRSRDDTGYDVEVNLDLSGFSESRSCSSSVVLATDSKQLPEAIVPVRAKYVAPATIDPSMIVIGSDEVGEVKKELHVATSRLSRLRAVVCPADSIRADYRSDEKSREHVLRLSVAPCRERMLDSQVKLELELFPDDGKSIVHVVTFPVHRLFRKGSENE